MQKSKCEDGFVAVICDCYWLIELTTGRAYWPPADQSEPPATSAHSPHHPGHPTLSIAGESFTPTHSSILDSALTRCKWSHGMFLFFLLSPQVNSTIICEVKKFWMRPTVEYLSSFYFQLEKFSQVTEMISIGCWGPLPPPCTARLPVAVILLGPLTPQNCNELVQVDQIKNRCLNIDLIYTFVASVN